MLRALVLTVALAACAAAHEPAPPANATPSASAAETGPSPSAEPSQVALTPPSAGPSPPPEPAGPSRETLCEKALFDLERSAAAPIDKCLGPKPSSSQPIAIDVRIDEKGSIAETRWDPSTTTAYGEKAARCILDVVKALAFAEPACSNEWLLLRRAVAQRPPNPIDSRL